MPDDETTEKDEAETLEMSQVVWEDGSQDSGEGRERYELVSGDQLC